MILLEERCKFVFPFLTRQAMTLQGERRQHLNRNVGVFRLVLVLTEVGATAQDPRFPL